MAISLVAGTVSAGTSSTTATKPTGVQSGDLLLIFAFSDGTASVPGAPSGFTTALSRSDTQGGGVTQTSAVFQKVAGSSEPATYGWTQGSGSTFNGWACVALRGADGATPVETSGSNGAGNASSVTVTALTASVTGDELLLFALAGSNTAISAWPSGVATYAAASNTANGITTGTEALTSSGSTGSLTTTFAAADLVSVLAVLVKPAASGSTPVTITDSGGAATDALSVSASFTLSDVSGAASEALSLASMALTVADTSSAASDAVSVAIINPVTVADASGASTASLTASASFTLSDATGASTDAQSVTASFSLADTSAPASDSISVNQGGTNPLITDSSGASASSITLAPLALTLSETSSAAAESLLWTVPIALSLPDASAAAGDALAVQQITANLTRPSAVVMRTAGLPSASVAASAQPGVTLTAATHPTATLAATTRPGATLTPTARPSATVKGN